MLTRNRLVKTSIFFTLVLCLYLQSSAAGAKVFDPEVFTLDNGLEVVVIPNHRAPIVTHMVWYRVGAADEAPGESGLAHFLGTSDVQGHQ